ncbi:hypothetical protein [uncultured Zhongshania sp.]|uniref:hypothetical protein n=1 Tax=uncultured Zhongshania sp. TaxID=1642288 RepID=UPI0030DB0AB2
MASRHNYTAWWCLCVLLLSGCAGHVENKRFALDDQVAPIFSGIYKRDVFLEGSVAYEDTANSQFDGKFDSKGYPQRGELRQSYTDGNNERLEIRLNGDFKLNASARSLSFLGAFTIVDSQQRVLAEGKRSHWLAHYPELHPFRAPPLMAMDGKTQYLQYRRDISPEGRPEAFPVVHRNLTGPFRLDVSFRGGLPRGVIKVSAQRADNTFYTVERQYFNYQIVQNPIQYFYYEPGSFSNLELLGNCERAPNLTVPQKLLQAFAYDCENAKYYALSEDYPASVIEIAAKDLDNGGLFHRLRIYHHGVITKASVNVDAIYDGKWLYHGPVTVMHYGQLQSYRNYELGKPVGIGIRADEQGAEYLSFGQESTSFDLPDDDFRDKLDSRYEWYKQRINTQFNNVLGDTILSPRELAKLKSALLEDIEENQPIAKDGQVAGLANLWASWQRQGIARLATWNTAKRDSATAMKAQILDDLDKWYEQSEALLLDESMQRCARGGKSFNEADWRCERSPGVALEKVCKRYFDEAQCADMSADFAKREGSSPEV